MKRTILHPLLLSLLFSLSVSASPPAVLLEKGIFLQETKQDYSAAVRVFDQALQDGKLNQYEIRFRKAACLGELGQEQEKLRLLTELANEEGDNAWIVKAQQEVQTSHSIARQHLETLIRATQENDLKLFRSVCNDTMKQAMSKPLMHSVHTKLSPFLKEGSYQIQRIKSDTSSPLLSTYEWHLILQKGQTITASMTLDSNQQVAGFYYR